MSDFSTEANRCLHCSNAQCRVGCPVHYDIPQFLQLCKQGNIPQAVATVGHLFGEVCGSVCPREKQCKGHCILGKRGIPVDVGEVERLAFLQHFPKLTISDYALGHLKIAVVGGGVSGVTFAEQCYRHGADVTIYEKNQLLHTLYSVPSFRLPKKALTGIVSAVQHSKIKVEKRTVDANFLQELLATHNVVYLATGAMLSNKMGVDGEQYATVADDFLRGTTFGDAIIVGGGNTAMDCARLNARSGNQTFVAYRRTRQDMPAFDAEVDCALQDGVQFGFNLAPVSVAKRENKLLVTFAETISDGRGKLTLTDRLTVRECDILVVAAGNRYDNSLYGTEKYLTVDENNCVCDNLLAGGDATGKSLVAEAVADAINACRKLVLKYKR